jgi:hypothetical protein
MTSEAIPDARIGFCLDASRIWERDELERCVNLLGA